MPTSSPIAKQPPLIRVRPTRALVSFATALTHITEEDEDGILSLLADDLVLGPGWNIASAGAKRKEWRVLMHYVDLYLASYAKPRRLSDDEHIKLIIPHTRPVITGRELQRYFNCKSGLILKLIAEGSLQTVPGTRWHPGRNGSPAITRDSVIKFLNQTQEI